MALLTLEDVIRLRNIEVAARHIVAGTVVGLHRSPYHGFSVTFSDHRPYVPGDDIRYLDWKVLARLRRKYIRRFEEETNLYSAIIVDASPSMYYPLPGREKFHFALFGAAALIYLLWKQRDLFTFLWVGGTDQWVRPNARAPHYHATMGRLDAARSQRPVVRSSSVIETLEYVALQMPRRSLIVLFSDLIDDLAYQDVEAFIKRLRRALRWHHARKNDVLIVHVVDEKTEQNLYLEHDWLTLEDSEVPIRLPVAVPEVRDTYRQVWQQWTDRLAGEIMASGADYVRVNVQGPFAPVIMAFLARRAKMQA